jgi:peptidyl-prolyl cis-trans isomerase B (cyclophilin B)
MAARQEAAARRRKTTTVVASSVAGVVVILLVVWLVVANTGGHKKAPVAAASTSATPISCTWTPNPNPNASASASPSASPTPSAAPNPYLKNVGTPPASGEPRSGYRDLTFVTNLGTIVVEMDLSHAPCTSESFTYLASKKFFDNASCHRLVNQSGTDSSTGEATEFHVLQCGDPSGTGQGGPSYTVADENLPTNQRPAYPEGVVAMANSGANTNGSQFFFVYADTLLPASYTIFGHIIQGMDILKKVAAGGDDEAFASAAGGGHPKTPLKFTTVTAGNVSTTPAPSPTPSATPSTSPSASASPSKS